jgi:hypothetical protein
MKTTTLITTVLFGLFVNAGFGADKGLSGNLGVSYETDHFFRGQAVASETLNSSIGLDASLGSFEAFADVSAFHSLSGGSDKYDVSGGLGTTLLNGQLGLSAGLLHYELLAGESNLDAFIAANLDVVLDPTITVYRNTDENLWTYELGLSHDVEIKDIATLTLGASAGLTETSVSTEVEYFEVSGELSRGITENLDGVVSVAYNDADNRDSETLASFGVRVSF